MSFDPPLDLSSLAFPSSAALGLCVFCVSVYGGHPKEFHNHPMPDSAFPLDCPLISLSIRMSPPMALRAYQGKPVWGSGGVQVLPAYHRPSAQTLAEGLAPWPPRAWFENARSCRPGGCHTPRGRMNVLPWADNLAG